MPATTGKYANNELEIYRGLMAAGLNRAAACGVLANLQAESGFNPINLQNSYENKLGYTDESYTSAVNSGNYDQRRFTFDSAGYGIAQWTYSTRKGALYNYARNTMKTSIGDLSMQINFLIKELKADFKDLWNDLLDYQDTAAGAEAAGAEFCREFERPAGGETTAAARGRTARNVYWAHYSDPDNSESSAPVSNIGSKIVDNANNCVGKSYIAGGDMYDTNKSGADDPGLVYYCYREAGVGIRPSTAQGYYDLYIGSAKKVTLDDLALGDLLFYENSEGKIGTIAIATSQDTRVYASSGAGLIVREPIGNPTYILRILADSETTIFNSSSSTSSQSGGEAIDYISLSAADPHTETIGHNLSRVEAVGYDYGYLIDMTYGEEFKFYIPEFTEQAGANWSPVNIRGRSVAVQSYDSTNSRTITISLDLYAGVGLYAAKSGESGLDTVSRLHSDAYFLKSLEYPDYSNVIARPPATVHLILGSAINIVGVVSNVTVEHLKPLDEFNRAMYLKVSFTVTQVAVNPPDYRDVRDNQYTATSTQDISSLYDKYSGPATVAPVFTERRNRGWTQVTMKD